ncbi:hypothetical protein PALB_10250 [Pseudoalteromonas luteoviolacea B = ATCC 29581]|nr:hypothetical protein PALB_10250 [Pseudoalteromonas luteoviolacea B = ATCC 29581]
MEIRHLDEKSLSEYTAEARARLAKKLDSNPFAENHEIHGLSNEEYRKTALWKKYIRPWILYRDERKCQACGDKRNTQTHPLDIHHRDYTKATLEGKSDKGLITLCRSCHWQVEFMNPESESNRRSEEQKEEKLVEMLALYQAKITEQKRIHEETIVELIEEKKRGCINLTIALRHGEEIITPSYSFKTSLLVDLFRSQSNGKTPLSKKFSNSRAKLHQGKSANIWSGGSLEDKIGSIIVLQNGVI